MKRFPLSLWLFALFIAALTSLPYLVGQWRTPDGWQYSGASAVPVGAQIDYNSHLAKMWQGYRGQFTYRLLFTHEPHLDLPVVQSFYLALGWLARLTSLSLPLVYHLARFAFTLTLVLSLWAFARRVFTQPRERWLVILFGTLASGWSWWLLFIDPVMTRTVAPIEFWLADAFNLFGAFQMPHFAAAMTLHIVTLLTFDDWVRTDKTSQRNLLWLTLALAGLAILQPYSLLLFIPLLTLLAAYHLFSSRLLTWRRGLWLGIPFGLHLALVGYQYLALNSDPIWRSFTEQNITASPLVTYYLLGYLPFIIPILLGARRFMLESADDRWWMPLLWVALVAMLLYAPFPTQRRYLLGVQTPLAVMAAYGWSRAVLPRLSRSWRGLATAVYLLLASIGLLAILLVNIAALANPVSNAAFYQPGEMQAFAWLRQNATPDDVVLTTFDAAGQGSGGRLVAALGQHVYLGHWIETADYLRKQADVERFYQPATTDSWRQQFLKETGIAYIWYDESARALGSWQPSAAGYLQPVFESDSISLLKVILNGG